MRRGVLGLGALAVTILGALVLALGGLAAGPPIPVRPYVYVSIDDQSAVEGQTASMTIHSSVAVPFPIEVYWQTSSGSAIPPADYPPQSGEAVIPAGKTSTTCPLSSEQDRIHEHPETFAVHIWSSSSAVRYEDADAVFTIVDDDPVPTVHIADAATITEGRSLVFPLTLSNPTVDPVIVSLNPAAEGTSANWKSDDYTGTAATSVAFPPLATAAQYSFATRDDGVYERAEHVSLQLTGGTNAQLPGEDERSAVGVVDDNTPMPTVSITGPGNIHWSQPMVFTITVSGPSELPVFVTTSCSRAFYLGPEFMYGDDGPYAAYWLEPMQTSETWTFGPYGPDWSYYISFNLGYAFGLPLEPPYTIYSGGFAWGWAPGENPPQF